MKEISEWIARNHSWIIWLLPIIIPIVVTEVGECATYISRGVISVAASILGFATTSAIGKSYKEQWLSELPQRPGKLVKLAFTIFMLAEALPRLWWVLEGQNIPANLSRAITRKFTGWHRARHSPKPGVELARLYGKRIAFRSRRSRPGVLVFDEADVKEFIKAAKNGAYDLDSLWLFA